MSEREDKEVEKVKKCLNWFAKNIPKAAPDLLALPRPRRIFWRWPEGIWSRRAHG